MSTELRQWEDMDGSRHAHLRIEEQDAYKMDREAREMISDAIWLIEAALRKRTTGPLTLPRTGLHIRTEDEEQSENCSPLPTADEVRGILAHPPNEGETNG